MTANLDLVLPKHLVHLKEMDWSQIRPIYKKLSDEFNVLLRAFDVKIDGKTKIYLDHLIGCIDLVDTAIDNVSEKNLRDKLTVDMTSLLDGRSEQLSKEFEYPLLEKSLLNLRLIAIDLNIKTQILNSAKIIFRSTEDKRHVSDIEEFISLVQQEGEATALLPLSLMGSQSNKKFTAFFSDLCRLMGVADLVADARADYCQGLISFKPSLRIYSKLLFITINSGLKLLINIPNKFRFLQYCIKFIPLLWKKD